MPAWTDRQYPLRPGPAAAVLAADWHSLWRPHCESLQTSLYKTDWLNQVFTNLLSTQWLTARFVERHLNDTWTSVVALCTRSNGEWASEREREGESLSIFSSLRLPVCRLHSSACVAKGKHGRGKRRRAACSSDVNSSKCKCNVNVMTLLPGNDGPGYNKGPLQKSINFSIPNKTSCCFSLKPHAADNVEILWYWIWGARPRSLTLY